MTKTVTTVTKQVLLLDSGLLFTFVSSLLSFFHDPTEKVGISTEYSQEGS